MAKIQTFGSRGNRPDGKSIALNDAGALEIEGFKDATPLFAPQKQADGSITWSDLRGPPGRKGDKGDMGNTGERGEQGERGPPGQDGEGAGVTLPAASGLHLDGSELSIYGVADAQAGAMMRKDATHGVVWSAAPRLICDDLTPSGTDQDETWTFPIKTGQVRRQLSEYYELRFVFGDGTGPNGCESISWLVKSILWFRQNLNYLYRTSGNEPAGGAFLQLKPNATTATQYLLRIGNWNGTGTQISATSTSIKTRDTGYANIRKVWGVRLA